MSNLIDFREYIEEQKNLSFGVELGGTPAVVGSVAREYDFILEAIDVYLEQVKEEHTLNENQQIVLGHLQGSAGQEGCLTLAVSTLANINHCTAVDAIDDSKYFKKIRKAFWSLTRKQEAEVLQAFAEWGLGHD
ncbi:hypothetical protein CKN73_07480 [Carnobacterium divergens]|uniref:hypothetical protein n=1 Tax=Carnobacterium divergens TaxID=2748 RepID=UPI00107280DE|nr:hypothetical protein [Carnobacterium divergens]TFJ40155.1 hypothetical protein CKN77_07580 [Carnobacterium divergens]TFJ48776.1 hypothetical protein CKN73_07480 [Carnobacterium divergens]TFJ54040.1 hypothetical protein CKN83_07385 [Carnobacterium divergens]TFJ59566.1 hypothetical protein CKN89_07825 [Carnobacterium divergens]TFJ70210.1 hypothetical protein CKN91_07440 [Carnobacterium divergens]